MGTSKRAILASRPNPVLGRGAFGRLRPLSQLIDNNGSGISYVCNCRPPCAYCSCKAPTVDWFKVLSEAPCSAFRWFALLQWCCWLRLVPAPPSMKVLVYIRKSAWNELADVPAYNAVCRHCSRNVNALFPGHAQLVPSCVIISMLLHAQLPALT